MSINRDILKDDFLKNEEIVFSEFNFTGKLAGKVWKLEQAVEKIRRAKLTLFILGAIIILTSFFAYLQTEDQLSIVSGLIVGKLFILAATMVKKYPVVAILIPLVLYIILIVIQAGGDLFELYQGIVWKILIIFLLGFGAYNAVIAKTIKQELITMAKSASSQES